MTPKDYIFLASLLRIVEDVEKRLTMAFAVEQHCRQNYYTNFDVEKFMEAIGVLNVV